MIRIGMLMFPRMTQLDFTGPFEVFAKLPDTTVHLLWKTLDPVAAETGLRLMPDTTLADCPKLDVICVPGGPGVDTLMEDETVLSFLRTQAETARYVTSVCTGSLVLGAAGLLRGIHATTHWSAKQYLAPLGAIPTDGRVVRDGRFFTGGGVTAGIDFALTLAAEIAGTEVAQGLQLRLEYNPAPPFDAGSPGTAPASVLAAQRARDTRSGSVWSEMMARVTARL